MDTRQAKLKPFRLIPNSEVTYSGLSWIEKTENDVLVFLCECILWGLNTHPFREWMRSADGLNIYYETKDRFRKSTCVEEIALVLIVLGRYGTDFWETYEDFSLVSKL